MNENLKSKIDPEILRILQQNPELLLSIAGDKFKISIESVDAKQNENSSNKQDSNEITQTNQGNSESLKEEVSQNTRKSRKSRAKSPNFTPMNSIDSVSFPDTHSHLNQNSSMKEPKSGKMSNRYNTTSRTPSLSEIEQQLEGIKGKEGEQLKKIAKALKRQRVKLEKSSSHNSVFGMKDDPLRALINELRDKKLKEIQTPSINETSLHLAFVFASPLVMAIKDAHGNPQKRPMKSPIQYRKEFEFIQASFREIDSSVRFQAAHASLNSFSSLLDKKPFCLHFCGHGIRNSSEILGNYIDRRQGDFLVFEDESLGADFVSCKALGKMLEKCKACTKLVFVASCHSELVGNVFLEAGASHVICVRREEKIMDLACQTFSKAFYHALIPGKFSICEAFSAAIARVFADFKIPNGEENKFQLLISQDEPHVCSFFPKLFPGHPLNCDATPKFLHIPSSIDNFVGRDREMNEIISNFSHFRLVSITGIPGIGKSAIAKEIANLLKERNKFSAGISFFQLRNIESAESLQCAIDSLIHDVTDAKSKADDRSKLLLKIVTTLKPMEIFFIFDNCDLILMGPEKMRFRMFLECLLTSCPKLKILCTNRVPIGGPLGDSPEKIIKVLPLNPMESRQLFNFHLPKSIYEDPTSLLELLKGHPYAITLAAGLLDDNTLAEVEHKLHFPRHSFTFPSLEESGPLKLSMDLALEWVSNKFHENVGKLFAVFGLLPGGISESDLDFVVGEPCEENLKILVNSSLLVKSGKNYQVYPFLLKYAESRNTRPEKSAIHKRIIALYSKKIEDVYFAVGSVTGTDFEVYDSFREYEVNIKACIYREKGTDETLINRLSFIPIEEGELEEQDSVSMPLTKESLKLLQLSTPKKVYRAEVAKPIENRQKGFGEIEMPIAGRLSYTLKEEKSLSKGSLKCESSEERKFETVTFSALENVLKTPNNSTSKGMNVPVESSEEEFKESLFQEANKNASFSFKIGFGNSSSNSREMSKDMGIKRKQLARPNSSKLQNEVKRKVGNLNKLLVQYTSILLMTRRYKECTSLIHLAFSLPHNDNLLIANLLKVKASLSFISKDMISAFNEFSEAEELFREEGCSLGIAICTGAKGYIKFIIGEHAKARLYLESSLKTYYSLKHSYGEHYIHRWLAAVKRKIGSLAHQSQSHVEEARKVLTGSKSLKVEKFKHKGGIFVLRWMGDNISLFLENAFVSDIKPVRGGKMEKMERISMLQKEDINHASENLRFLEF